MVTLLFCVMPHLASHPPTPRPCSLARSLPHGSCAYKPHSGPSALLVVSRAANSDPVSGAVAKGTSADLQAEVEVFGATDILHGRFYGPFATAFHICLLRAVCLSVCLFICLSRVLACCHGLRRAGVCCGLWTGACWSLSGVGCVVWACVLCQVRCGVVMGGSQTNKLY